MQGDSAFMKPEIIIDSYKYINGGAQSYCLDSLFVF